MRDDGSYERVHSGVFGAHTQGPVNAAVKPYVGGTLCDVPDPILTTLLTKARAFAGPFIGLALLGGAGGWYLRGTAAAQSTITEDIRRLDATTVRRDEFATVVLRLDAVAARTDSTNALLRRLICKQYPSICP